VLSWAPAQVTYATPQLKAACKLPPGIDASDEVAMAGLDLLVSIADMQAALPQVPAQSLRRPSNSHADLDPETRALDLCGERPLRRAATCVCPKQPAAEGEPERV